MSSDYPLLFLSILPHHHSTNKNWSSLEGWPVKAPQTAGLFDPRILLGTSLNHRSSSFGFSFLSFHGLDFSTAQRRLRGDCLIGNHGGDKSGLYFGRR